MAERGDTSLSSIMDFRVREEASEAEEVPGSSSSEVGGPGDLPKPCPALLLFLAESLLEVMAGNHVADGATNAVIDGARDRSDNTTTNLLLVILFGLCKVVGGQF